MSAAANNPTLHVLRGILRRLRTKTDLVGDSSGPTRNYILNQYRVNQSIQGPEATALQKLASDYLAFMENLQERARLQDLDAGAEVQLSPKEMSRRAAARAGLQLPDLNPDLK